MSTPTRTRDQVQKVGRTLVSQARAVLAMLEQLDADDFSRPCGIGAGTIRDAVALMSWNATALVSHLGRPTTTRPVTLAAYLRTRREFASTAQRAASGTCEGFGPADMVANYRLAVDSLEEALLQDISPVIETRYDAVRAIDAVRTRIIEVVTHADDLSGALPDRPAIPLQRDALFDASRSFAEVIATLHPGRSVELRVPPATAVQLATAADEPVHTRGTPPTVVETDPLTFVRLCAGRLPWAEALRTYAVTASGAHADLAGVFPVFALS